MLFVSTGLLCGDLCSAFDVFTEVLNVNISFFSGLLGSGGFQILVRWIIKYACVEIHFHWYVGTLVAWNSANVYFCGFADLGAEESLNPWYILITEIMWGWTYLTLSDFVLKGSHTKLTKDHLFRFAWTNLLLGCAIPLTGIKRRKRWKKTPQNPCLFPAVVSIISSCFGWFSFFFPIYLASRSLHEWWLKLPAVSQEALLCPCLS